MNTTRYSKVLIGFGTICCICGYLLNNFYGAFLGITIFLYIYFLECISNLKVDLELEESALKERHPSKIRVKVQGKNILPFLNFSSSHGTLSCRVLRGKVVKYLIEVVPFKKGEFLLSVKGKLYDLREMFSRDYEGSFELKVEPSLEGLKYQIERETQISLLSKGTPDPEIGELKIYEIGDDFKRIDWKKSFTSGRLIVRKLTYLEERCIYILLDVGNTMRRFTKRDRSKLDYAISLLLNIVEGSREDMDIILYDDHRILEVYSVKKVGYLRRKILQEKILKDLLDIKQVPLDKYIPNIRGIYESRDYGESCILQPYLSKRGKGSFGILQCAKLLTKMKTGIVIIITDLESNITPLFKSVNILIKKGFKVMIYALYTPSFNLDEGDLKEDLLVRLYKHYENRKRIIKNLRKKGVTVVDISYRDSIRDIIEKMKMGRKYGHYKRDGSYCRKVKEGGVYKG